MLVAGWPPNNEGCDAYCPPKREGAAVDPPVAEKTEEFVGAAVMVVGTPPKIALGRGSLGFLVEKGLEGGETG